MADITILGKNGQIASALAEILDDAVFLGSDELDLSQPGSVYETLQEFEVNSDYIINCMAYTAVDKADKLAKDKDAKKKAALEAEAKVNKARQDAILAKKKVAEEALGPLLVQN